MASIITAPLPSSAPDSRAAARDHILRTYTPSTPEERILAEQIAENWWRLTLARRAEAALIDDAIAAAESPDLALGKALAHDPGLARVLRYVTAAERALHLAVEHFRRARAAHVKSETDAAKRNNAVARASADKAFLEFHQSVEQSEAELERLTEMLLAEDCDAPPNAATVHSGPVPPHSV
jgi:hypothetical protein